MNDWRNEFNKLVAGGCGTQFGMILAFGLFVVVFLLCMGCALSGLLSITVRDFAGQIAQAAQAGTISGEAVLLDDEPDALLAYAPETPTPTVIPSPTPIYIAKLPATGDLDPTLPSPIVTADQGRANLRLGPGRSYPRIGILPEDASLQIVGRNQDTSWWLVATTKGLAWVSAGAVSASHIQAGIPIVDFTIPPEQSQYDPQPLATTSFSSAVAGTTTDLSYPAGTPTAPAIANRLFVKDTPGYKKMSIHLNGQIKSENFAPRGDPILMAEGIQLQLVAGDGSYGKLLADSTRDYRVFGDAVWSPDGEHIAFVIHYTDVKCEVCRAVALYRLADDTMTILETPKKLDAEAPRWTQDGRVLVLVHPGDPADGFPYIYNTAGQGQMAEGTFLLSTSHDGQKWHPWLPGRLWQTGISERSDSYYRD